MAALLIASSGFNAPAASVVAPSTARASLRMASLE